MATKGDIEDENGSLSDPFVDHRKREAEEHCSSGNGGSMMVYISTFIASCGSFQFGYCAMGIASIICILEWIAIYIAPLLVVTGLAVAFAIGACVSWRTLALTGTVSSILLFVGLFFIPESPRWLAMFGRQREFEAALSKLRGLGSDISTEQADIEDSLAIIRQLPKISIPDLLSGRNIRLISIAVVLMAFQQLVGINGINYYAAEIFKSAGVSPSMGSILYSSTQVVITAIGATLVDRAGRRPLLMDSVFGLFIGNLLIGSSFLLKVYIASFSIGMGTIPWVLMSELFPLNIKAIGGSLVTLINWFGSWVISYSFFYLFSWSSVAIFYLYGSMCVLALIFTIKFVPETKGRTLEEIQALMD
ncbi:hypothetical protein Ddye_028396 [Dipteronia dyeriana]|uniref:Major facilitator superfamily (MFS) profile domain-containing protein n=1 Tax=Dipteronia dyeriana TaxID=168575 RepID=A0AAD9TR39_9ROSI|nr:hypothetical protein Ddye_028396 [Dipteronia dyeriana]